MGEMFGELVAAMDKTDADIIRDLFVGAISYREAGQYFTAESLTRLMAQMTVDPDARPENGRPIDVNDPCCGTGRMLLEASNINPHAELVGQDIDARCAKITAINLGLRGRHGWALCGNSLSGETKFAYRVGSFFNETPNGLRRGVIRDVPPEQTPVPALSWRLRNQATEMLSAEPSHEPPTPTPALTIVEVPQWLARLEPLAATKEPSIAPPPPQASPSSDTDASAASRAIQRRLF